MSDRKTTKERGASGEATAAAYVGGLGWTIEARNVQFRCGELDIVAWDGDQLVFVEVRSTWRRGSSRVADTVTFPKQRRLTRAAGLYMAKMGYDRVSARFDVIGVDRGRSVVVDHARGAFDAVAF